MAWRSTLTAIALILVSTASASRAADVITNADWIKKPKPEDIMGVWPREAMRRGQNGEATIRCQVSVLGALVDCQVVEEKPAGMKFGAAAVALAPQMLMKPATSNGRPVVSQVAIPIRFSGLSPAIGSRIPGGGTPAPLDTTRRVIAGVAWTQAPSFADVAAAYPQKARERGVGGRATLDCTFTDKGTLAACDVLQEEPQDLGFGRAAKALASGFATAPVLPDGQKLAGVGIQTTFAFTPETLATPPPVVSRPRWSAVPSAEDFAAALSATTAKSGDASARVVLACLIQTTGALGGCKVAAEEPPGLDLGAGALGLASKFQVRLWSDEGLPMVGGQIRVPIRFQLRDAQPAPPPPPKP